ncbi:MAG: O-antigen ligase family protein [Chloroflexi bacterium]|nr:O-antigen ligase family protein [Chloroflexota bacterium]MBI3339398.1 O-antigen ligase family protein [Chloroflexota bacterium]
MLIQKLKLYSRSSIHVTEFLAACVLGLLLGAVSIWASPIGVMLVFAGGVFALAATRRHELLLLAYLIFTSTIIDDTYNPSISIGFGTMYLTDVIIFTAFVLVILRSLSEPDFELIHTPLDFPLIMFWGVTMFSTFLAIFQGNITLNASLGAIRSVSSYLLFFAVTNLVRKERQLDLLWKGMSLFAIFTAFGMIAQYIAGSSVRILPGRVETLNTEGVRFSDITRIIPPGDALIFFVFIVFTVSIMLKARKSSSISTLLSFGLLGLGTLLTYKRHLFIGFGIAVILLFVLLNSRDKVRLLSWAFASTLIIAIAVLLISMFPGSKALEFVTASSNRFLSLVSSETYSNPNSSLQWRSFEYQYALPQIASHPLIGMGLDTRYRPFVRGRDYLPGGDFRRFVHNGHVAILLRSGLLGYMFFAWLSVAFIWRGFKYWRDIPDLRAQALVLGLTLTYIGVLIGTVVSPIILTANWTPVIGIMFGTNEVIFKNFDVKRLRFDRLSTETMDG